MSADHPITKNQAEAALRSLSLPDVCTEDVLAEHLGIPITTIQRALAKGQLPGRLVQGRWFIGRTALFAWLNSLADADRGCERGEEDSRGRLRRVPDDQIG